jgi:UDP-N-acetylglucosamine:LPS N-acetylglucosamine transferase
VEAIATTYLIQNIGTNPVRLLLAFFWSFCILRREKPAVVLSMGAEIAIPFFYCARLLGINTVFIESWCRVQTLSRTAKLVYPVADVFWVQWPQLLDRCGPKAQFKGAVL